MLAQQGWRLVNNDNSLVTSIMKARYDMFRIVIFLMQHKEIILAIFGAT